MIIEILGKQGKQLVQINIWSLGVIFFEMITGIPPFQERSVKHKIDTNLEYIKDNNLRILLLQMLNLYH